MIRVSTNPLEKEDVRQEQQQMATLGAGNSNELSGGAVSDGIDVTEELPRVTDDPPRLVNKQH